MSSELKYTKFLSNINATVTYVKSSLMYCILYTILLLFFFLGEISCIATLVNPSWSNTSNTTDSISLGYLNTKKRVENMTCSGLFLIKFKVFAWIDDETLSQVFDVTSQSKQKLRSKLNGEVKSLKLMLIKTRYANLCQGCDFLCFNLMNY